MNNLRGVQKFWIPTDAIVSCLHGTLVRRVASIFGIKLDWLSLIDLSVIAPYHFKLSLVMHIQLGKLLSKEMLIKSNFKYVIKHIKYEVVMLRAQYWPHIRTSIYLN